jgi:hypothetical protein
MNNETFFQVQTAELQRLLDTSADDPILGPQLRDRLDEVKKRLQATRQEPGTLLPKETRILPRAAIFLRGGGVHDSEAIRPSLAGEALIQYEKMFTEQAIHDERLAARTTGRQRRPRGAPIPGLWFTGTPRGSFGLEFSPQIGEDESLLEVHAQSLENIADALTRVAASGSLSLDEIVSNIPSRVLQHLKQFLTVLAQNGAELRLAFPDRPSRFLSESEVKIAAERLDREVTQETLAIKGKFRGLTLESGSFDLITDDGLIKGTVADDLTEEDLERIHNLTNQQCVADLERTTVRKVGGTETTSYVLLDARSGK